jgi:predicted nucleic acid-binding protein
MISKVFFDTNVLIYAADKNNPQKQSTARHVLRESAALGNGVLSTQVLQEFYVIATSKLGLNSQVVKALICGFQNMEVVQITPALIHIAIDTSLFNKVSFWDALIVAAAESAACEILMTEDLNSGQTIRGVFVRDPFAAEE